MQTADVFTLDWYDVIDVVLLTRNGIQVYSKPVQLFDLFQVRRR